MSQDGYTLAETLAALVMIGLAIGGLTAGVRVIALNQAAAARRAAEAGQIAAVQRGLSRLVSNEGPFQSDDLNGLRADGRGLHFPCESGTCGAEIATIGGRTQMLVARGGRSAMVLPGAPAAVSFAYVGSRTTGEVWPPKGDQPETLKTILVLVGKDAAPLATVRLWREHPINCAFDPISQSCRQVGQ